MEADAGLILDYYRRAAQDAASPWRKRQDTPSDTGTPTTTTSTDLSTSSVASVSSDSVASTSSQTSVASTSSTAATSTRSTTSGSSTSLSTITTSVPSTLSSTFLTINSSGQSITSTVIIVPTTSVTTNPSNKSTNTGPIVGGVIGGVAAIALIALGIWLVRRKMKRDEFEANIFDPDRNIERPSAVGAGRNFDLGGGGYAATAAGAGAGAAAAGAAMSNSDHTSNVTPYHYGAPSSSDPASTFHGSSVAGAPEMRQQSPIPSTYYQNDYNYPNYAQQQQQPYNPTPSVAVGETFPNPYAPGYHPAQYPLAGAAGVGAGLGMAAAANDVNRGQTQYSTSSGYPPASTVYSPTSEGRVSPSASPPMGATAGLAPAAAMNPRSAKEREAFSRTNNNSFAVSNPTAPVEPPRTNPSPTPSRTSVHSPVIVHQDGGRAPEEEEPSPEGEIPPTYDSIPRDR